MEQETKKSIYKQWWFWVAGLFLFFVVIGNLGGKSDKVVENDKSQPAQSATPAPDTKVNVGEEGYVHVSSPKAILALTEDNFKELTKIYLANDTQGIYEFLVAGKGFAVENGTKVKVIDSSFGSRRVRVLEGDMTEKSGWIAMEWVSKTK